MGGKSWHKIKLHKTLLVSHHTQNHSDCLLWSYKTLESVAPGYTIEINSCSLAFCSSHSGLLLLWAHQVNTLLWTFIALFPLRLSFLFSHCISADSLFMTQHKHYFPRKTEHCYPTWNSTHLKHLYHISDFLHCIQYQDVTWYFLIYIYRFISPPPPHMI